MPDNQTHSRAGSSTRRTVIGIVAVTAGLGLVLAVIILGPFRNSASKGPVPSAAPVTPPEGEPAVTPPVAAEPGDAFEDVTLKAGLRFVHQFCDTRIANII